MNFIHLLHLARSSCQKRNYKPSGRNRPCDSGAAELNSIVFVLIEFIHLLSTFTIANLCIYTVYVYITLQISEMYDN